MSINQRFKALPRHTQKAILVAVSSIAILVVFAVTSAILRQEKIDETHAQEIASWTLEQKLLEMPTGFSMGSGLKDEYIRHVRMSADSIRVKNCRRKGDLNVCDMDGVLFDIGGLKKPFAEQGHFKKQDDGTWTMVQAQP